MVRRNKEMLNVSEGNSDLVGYGLSKGHVPCCCYIPRPLRSDSVGFEFTEFQRRKTLFMVTFGTLIECNLHLLPRCNIYVE